MIEEAEAIPYTPSRLRGERLLVLAPHPDDEAIACGGLIAQHLAERRAVRVLVATNGDQAGDAAAREDESRRGLALLGDHASIDFLGFPDRALAQHEAALQERLRDALRDFRPDLIAVPAPIEIHPDHLALARAFCELVQRDDALFAELAVARVAFYEVGQPLRPNALVDISDVAEKKWSAIAAHASQLAWRDYVSYARGLNTYRGMTLPAEVKFAEAYWTIELPSLRTMPFSAVRAAAGDAPRIDAVREPVPVSVVVRTKDRPALLREALDSIRAYPAAEIVIVNDGGQAIPPVPNAKLIEHAESKGRSLAANEGVRAASSAFLVFLDDDDLHYPEHLPTLTRAAEQFPQSRAWYSDALSTYAKLGASGALETQWRLRQYSQDFDRALLQVDNFIPLPTLLMRRDDFLDLGGFDPQFDLFEDWDFLLRLAARGDFVHVPRVTCEIRRIDGGGSITVANPEGSPLFREAKLRIWRKHGVTPEIFAAAFEQQKRRLGGAMSAAAEERGRRHHVETDIARLEREKQELIAKLQQQNDAVVASAQHAERLEGSMRAVGDLLAKRNDELQTMSGELFVTRASLDKTERELGDTRAAMHAAYAEIQRLNGLLNMIYSSRTWKLHSALEKMRGRG
jgi:LmbE family N-acetylglucosaminyl deacetylase